MGICLSKKREQRTTKKKPKNVISPKKKARKSRKSKNSKKSKKSKKFRRQINPVQAHAPHFKYVGDHLISLASPTNTNLTTVASSISESLKKSSLMTYPSVGTPKETDNSPVKSLNSKFLAVSHKSKIDSQFAAVAKNLNSKRIGSDEDNDRNEIFEKQNDFRIQFAENSDKQIEKVKGNFERKFRTVDIEECEMSESLQLSQIEENTWVSNSVISKVKRLETEEYERELESKASEFWANNCSYQESSVFESKLNTEQDEQEGTEGMNNTNFDNSNNQNFSKGKSLKNTLKEVKSEQNLENVENEQKEQRVKKFVLKKCSLAPKKILRGDIPLKGKNPKYSRKEC